jgi:nucleoside-diphosphate-sugar epimerase
LKPLADTRALVTGAAGFLGSHLCERLRASGADVHAVSRSEPPAEAREGLRWWRSAFDDEAEVERILGAVRPEVVFHLGGHVTASPEVAHVMPTFASLLASSVHVLVHAAERGARIVLAGSSTEPVGDGVPGSPYGAAKWCATAYARMFHALYATPVVITRPFVTYGPRQKDDKVIPYAITSLLGGRAPQLSSGGFVADWVYVDDVIDGFLKAATVPEAVGQEVDLGTGRLASVRDVVELIVEIANPPVKPRFGALPDRPKEIVRAAEVERTWAVLGWRATTSLRAGLERTIAWHRQRAGG